MTWYDHLGVRPTCSRQELQTAFEAQKARLEAARQHAKSPALRARVEVEWRAVHAAWDIVGHPVQRRAYDQHLGITTTSATPTSQKSSVPVGGSLLFLLLLTIAGIAHLAPLPLLIAGGSAILAATLWWVVAPHQRP